MTNRLAKETSPYLLQHAQNPVDWYSWGTDALEIAKRNDMPIFLSIGYSACHWCHVMAHESFEDENIASLLNKSFVNIKVDREERPDIDDVYQKACMKITGQGGWPLSVFLMPDQRPFYVGTYFPPLDMHGRAGFGSIISQMAQAWKEQRKTVEQGAARFMEQLDKEQKPVQASTKNAIERSSSILLGIADITNGGFGHAPKFPNAACISYLLRCSTRSESKAYASHALHTLRKMARGGIYDHVGGGFHRYSTDNRWFVPHFEKMTYDNALIPTVYGEAYALSGDAQYRRIMERTLEFSLREMVGNDGGFYSALDADSEGQEGQYYVWHSKEIRELLGDDADAFCLYYDVTQGGNWEGETILCNNIPLSAVALRYESSIEKLELKFDACLEKLLAERTKRTRPGLDDKTLTSWNSMMIVSLVYAGILTHNPKYTKTALDCADFIRKKMTARKDSEELLRSRRGDVDGKIPGYLEDYAWYADALTDLFCANGNPKHLEYANRLCAKIIERFYDSNGGFFMTGKNSHDNLIIRPRSIYDLAVPSGASVATRVLWKVGHLVGNESYIMIAKKSIDTRLPEAIQNPFAFCSTLCTSFANEYGPLEITVLDSGKSPEMLNYLDTHYLPEAIAVRISNQENLDALEKNSFFAGKKFENDSQRVYVCKNSVCSKPASTLENLKRELE